MIPAKKWQRVDHKTCIYALADPRTGEVRYVGKTTQKTRIRLAMHISHAKNRAETSRGCWVTHWVNSLLNLDMRPEIFDLEIIPENGDWTEAECFWIDVMKSWGFNLCNIRAGGEAGNFTKQSPETIEKRVSKLRGRPGRKLTDDQRAFARINLERGRLNRIWTAEQRAAQSIRGKELAKLSPRKGGAESVLSRAVHVDGSEYGSVHETARQRGVTRRTVYNWLRDGAAEYVDQINLGRPAPLPLNEFKVARVQRHRSIEIVGSEKYPSMAHLARKLGLNISTIAYRLKRGLPIDAPPNKTGLRNRA
jgi:hypothetical protein